MKAIKINDANMEKINHEISMVQGKARERLVDYSDIVYMVKDIEEKFNIPKKYMDGVVADVDWHSGKLPNAYKYTAYSTRVFLQNKRGNWYLIGVSRSALRQNNKRFDMILPEETIKKLTEKYEAFYA